jgi:hypothetical protein
MGVDESNINIGKTGLFHSSTKVDDTILWYDFSDKIINANKYGTLNDNHFILTFSPFVLTDYSSEPEKYKLKFILQTKDKKKLEQELLIDKINSYKC